MDVLTISFVTARTVRPWTGEHPDRERRKPACFESRHLTQHNRHGDPSMNKLYATIVTLSLSLGAAGASAQDTGPGAVAIELTETVMKVQTVNYRARSVTLETPEGDVVTLKVPPESQNLEQVYAGAKVRVSYVQS